MVAAAYAKLWNAQRGVVAAEAVSAVPLDAAQTRDVAKALGAATGREVDLPARVDPRLLGGMLVKMEGRTYDGSVRGRLLALRRTLAGTGASTGRGSADHILGRGAWTFAPKRSPRSSASSSGASPPAWTSPRRAPCSRWATASPASTASSAAWPASCSSCRTASWPSP